MILGPGPALCAGHTMHRGVREPRSSGHRSAIGAVIAEVVRDGRTSADIGLFELARFR